MNARHWPCLAVNGVVMSIATWYSMTSAAASVRRRRREHPHGNLQSPSRWVDDPRCARTPETASANIVSPPARGVFTTSIRPATSPRPPPRHSYRQAGTISSAQLFGPYNIHLSLTPVTRLGVYEVTAQIGEGWMGQVFERQTPKLKRQVAIKILPTWVAADAERVASCQREAEVLSLTLQSAVFLASKNLQGVFR